MKNLRYVDKLQNPSTPLLDLSVSRFSFFGTRFFHKFERRISQCAKSTGIFELTTKAPDKIIFNLPYNAFVDNHKDTTFQKLHSKYR